jgi:taurine dioxygenase
MSLSITPGKNNVGAFINNIFLKTLDQNLVAEIKKIINHYGVIFLKKQNVDPETYQNFANYFGKPVYYKRLKSLNDSFPLISVLERKPSDKNLTFGSSWLHQDTSYLKNDRPRYTMLLGVEIPEDQGDTIFSSGFSAYEKLPQKIKDKINNAIGVFSSSGPISATRVESDKKLGIKTSDNMEAEHSLVETVGKRKTLYVSPGHLIKIKNVKSEEAESLKNYLIEHVNKEEFIFSYKWSQGDIVLWDNLSILHKASDIKNCRRVMHRITIK